MNNKLKGFTLIELIIVICIIAILSSVALPSFFEYIKKSKVSQVLSDCKTLENCILIYYTSTGEWPRIYTNGSLQKPMASLEPLIRNRDNVQGWNGPYIESIPSHGFGFPTYIKEPDKNSMYLIGFLSPPEHLSQLGDTIGDFVICIITAQDNFDYVKDALDSTVDNNDGGNTGKIQWDKNKRIRWVIEQNISDVKDSTGFPQFPY